MDSEKIKSLRAKYKAKIRASKWDTDYGPLVAKVRRGLTEFIGHTPAFTDVSTHAVKMKWDFYSTIGDEDFNNIRKEAIRLGASDVQSYGGSMGNVWVPLSQTTTQDLASKNNIPELATQCLELWSEMDQKEKEVPRGGLYEDYMKRRKEIGLEALMVKLWDTLGVLSDALEESGYTNVVMLDRMREKTHYVYTYKSVRKFCSQLASGVQP